ncbi:MAG: hypothetical protein MOGMAGMI_01129 [Candidatus Omnitrophica bacterium]|nr:hypothetical protein [Candidatus Omnitrophota bacterium]
MIRLWVLLAVLLTVQPARFSWADEYTDWGLEKQGDRSIDETLSEAKKLIGKGQALSIGGIGKRIAGTESTAHPENAEQSAVAQPATPASHQTEPASRPLPTPRKIVHLKNGSQVPAQSVRPDGDGYWVTADEGLEMYFSGDEVLSVDPAGA